MKNFKNKSDVFFLIISMISVCLTLAILAFGKEKNNTVLLYYFLSFQLSMFIWKRSAKNLE